jgi:hypothetical protein
MTSTTSGLNAQMIADRLAAGRLVTKDGRTFNLVLTELQKIRSRAGWLRFVLTVRDQQGSPAATPLATGLISGGGRGVKPWLEMAVNPQLEFADGQKLDGRREGLEGGLIGLIGQLIPPGGHLMVEYENPAHSETQRALLLGVPAPATQLGSLMFKAGFRGHFKDWYISEGGHEGPRKLQANKSPTETAAREALRFNLHELDEFLSRPFPKDQNDADVIARAQERARHILRDFRDQAT